MGLSTAAVSRWSVVGRAVGLGATWGLATGAGISLLTGVVFLVPLGIVVGTIAGVLSGLAAGLLMVLAEAVRPSGGAAQSRLLGGLGAPVTVLVFLSVRPDYFTFNGITASLTVAMTVWGVIVGAGFGPFIATGLQDYMRDPATPDSLRVPARVSWLRIVVPVVVAALMAGVCWTLFRSIDEEARATGQETSSVTRLTGVPSRSDLLTVQCRSSTRSATSRNTFSAASSPAGSSTL